MSCAWQVTRFEANGDSAETVCDPATHEVSFSVHPSMKPEVIEVCTSCASAELNNPFTTVRPLTVSKFNPLTDGSLNAGAVAGRALSKDERAKRVEMYRSMAEQEIPLFA